MAQPEKKKENKIQAQTKQIYGDKNKKWWLSWRESIKDKSDKKSQLGLEMFPIMICLHMVYIPKTPLCSVLGIRSLPYKLYCSLISAPALPM